MSILSAYFAPPAPQFSNVIGQRTHLIIEDEPDLTPAQVAISQAARNQLDNLSRRILNIARVLKAVEEGCNSVPEVSDETKLSLGTVRSALKILLSEQKITQRPTKSNKMIYTAIDHD